MYILGISCWYHDGAAALLKDGNVLAAAEEERFTRIKHDYNFPVNAIDFCLNLAGITADDVDYVVFYDKPFLKFERILSSILLNVPKSCGVFREAVPLWLKEKLNFRRKVKKFFGINEDKVLFCYHHISHAASSFYLSPYEEAAILTVDGVGEWATATVGMGKGNRIKIYEELHFPHSVGLLYSAFTAFLGFKVNEGEYKVMGMAPYGKPKYIDKVLKVVKINENGSIELNMDYFSFPYSTKNTFNKKFIELFGEPRVPESFFFTKNSDFPVYYGEKPDDFETQAEKNQYYADIAASIQKVLEEILIKMAKYAYKKTGLKKLCYAGGVALNSKANYYILKDTPFDEIYIHPAATDAGGAIGAALWCWCEVLGKERKQVLEHSYLGKEFSETEAIKSLKEKNLKYEELNDEKLFDTLVESLTEGKIIGWYQGRTEWGPRALGNRSIIADPRNPKMKEIVNLKIKFREPFRPFAPSVLREEIKNYFEIEKDNYPQRFMLMTYPVKENKKRLIPAVTHVDGTSRLQSVFKEYNPRYHNLISKFKEKTGVGVVLNTSFNLRGEPIVNSPENAINTFLNSGIDLLVLKNFLIKK